MVFLFNFFIDLDYIFCIFFFGNFVRYFNSFFFIWVFIGCGNVVKILVILELFFFNFVDRGEGYFICEGIGFKIKIFLRIFGIIICVDIIWLILLNL